MRCAILNQSSGLSLIFVSLTSLNKYSLPDIFEFEYKGFDDINIVWTVQRNEVQVGLESKVVTKIKP